MNNLENKTEKKEQYLITGDELKDAYLKLAAVLETHILEERKKTFKNFKIEFPDILLDKELEYLYKIQQKCSTYTKNTSKTLEEFIYGTTQRNKDLADLGTLIMQYPERKIINQMKSYAKNQKVESTTITKLIQRIKTSMLNIVMEHITEHDEKLLNQLMERELEHLKLNYYLKNESLRILTPHKYKNFLQIVHKGIQAFYADFRNYPLLENPYLEIINNHFDRILLKIESLSTKYLIEFEKITHADETPLLSFPNHIFKNYEAFMHYKSSEKKATTPEDIGFLFRHFSEKSYPPQIITTETVFRAWHNNQLNSNIKLKAPIKTYASIGAKEKKILMLPTTTQIPTQS